MKRSDIMGIISNKEQSDKEIVDAIMELHGNDAEMWKAKKEELEQDVTSAKAEAQKIQQEFDTYKTDGTDNEWKSKYESEAAAHTATKETYKSEKENAETMELLRKGFIDEKANPKAIDLFLKTIDLSTVKKKDGKISNWEDISKPVKEQYSEFFGVEQKHGVDVGATGQQQKQTTEPKPNITATLFGVKKTEG